MPSRKEGLVVLYPEYFDSGLTRGEGRRVPKKIAKEAPTVEQLTAAARAADPALEPRAEPQSAYSPRWWDRRGRVLVRRIHPKQKIIQMVARRL
ncbi:MAG: signal recognition particle subunit SRP19/SEC65 family protein [Thermoplasmatota archaeon]